jgi:hypothetical protein
MMILFIILLLILVYIKYNTNNECSHKKNLNFNEYNII